MNAKRLLFLAIILGTIFTGMAQEVTVVKSEFIFNEAPFAQCHASTIEELPGNRFIAAWFGGTHERHPDVCIWGSINNGNGWSKPVLLADGIVNDTLRYPCWNPVLFRAKDKTLFLFYKIGPSPSEWWGLYKVSHNDGKNWSKAQKLPEGILGPIKNKPIQLPDGRILCPSSTESAEGWKAHIEISDNNGKSWHIAAIDPENNAKVIQPTLLQHKDGRIQALLRSDQNSIIESWSDNKGESWSKLGKTSIQNPNSGIDAVTLQNGVFMLVYNPTSAGKDWWNGRQKLNVAISDDGKTWKDVYAAENQPEGEFSYPAIIQSKNGLIHITYTSNRNRIKYLVLKLQE